jgi:hypothetical protein
MLPTLLVILQVRADEPAATYVIQSGRQIGQIDRVELKLEVAGDRLEPGDGKVERVPMSGLANLSYDEKTLDLADASGSHARSIRFYDKANAIAKVGEDGSKSELRPERRLIGVDLFPQRATLFSPRGLLNSDELDLIDAPGNSVLLDQLLPAKPVAVGDKWRLSDKLMAGVLGMDEVGHCDVECLLKEVKPTLARMELAGHVTGVIDGVPAEIDVQAKCRFDRRTNRIDWFAMLIGDKREAKLGDGMDVVVRLQVKISPIEQSTWLTDAALKGLPLKPTPELCQLIYQPAAGGWQLTHDRAWLLVKSHRKLAVLRLMANGADVAQCNISPLPKVAPDKLPSMEQFQEDVQKALGKNFGQLVEAGQFASEANYRVYRVVVKGEVSEVPIQWQYFLVGDATGRQVTFAFTVKEQNVEAFGNAGERLVRQLRFLDRKTTAE